jgi:hypothetical protein
MAAATIALVVAALLLAPTKDHQPILQPLITRAGNALFASICAAVGLLIVIRRPRNPIGWIYLVVSLSFALGEFAGAYTTRAQASTPPLPGAVWAAWIVDPTWNATVPIGAILLLLLFPTGRPPSPRWHPIIWVATTATVVVTVASAMLPAALQKSYPTARNPTGMEAASSLLESIVAVSYLLLAICFVASSVSLVVRWRRARGVERQQLKWLAFAGALLLIVEFSSPLVPHLLFQAVVLVAALLLPVATGLAILRYHLYDIDRVISRTLVYGLLTALLAAVYTAGVTTLGSLLSPSGDSSLAVAASTLAVAALFQPARRRIRNLVDRRFNRRRYDAIKTVALFSSRLRDQLFLDDLTGEILAVVNQTMEPANASLWLRPTFTAAEPHTEPQAAATGRSPSPTLQQPEQ